MARAAHRPATSPRNALLPTLLFLFTKLTQNKSSNFNIEFSGSDTETPVAARIFTVVSGYDRRRYPRPALGAFWSWACEGDRYRWRRAGRKRPEVSRGPSGRPGSPALGLCRVFGQSPFVVRTVRSLERVCAPDNCGVLRSYYGRARRSARAPLRVAVRDGPSERGARYVWCWPAA